jgi:putative SOS response-associated peptidase YedK
MAAPTSIKRETVQNGPRRIMPLLAPYPSELMEAYPVSTLVNAPANDRPECAEPDVGSLF